jgi:hypothetical protein
MFNRLIQTAENITTAVLNRFVKYDHYIDGSHKDHINASKLLAVRPDQRIVGLL